MAPIQPPTRALLRMPGPKPTPRLWSHRATRPFPCPPRNTFSLVALRNAIALRSTGRPHALPSPPLPHTQTRHYRSPTWSYHRRRALGLCYSCNDPLLEGYAYCAKHLQQHRVNHRRAYLEATQKGICGMDGCRELAAEGQSVCGEHLERQRKRSLQVYQEQLAKGLCTDGKCPNKAPPPYTKCDYHRERRRLAAKERRERKAMGEVDDKRGVGHAKKRVRRKADKLGEDTEVQADQ